MIDLMLSLVLGISPLLAENAVSGDDGTADHPVLATDDSQHRELTSHHDDETVSCGVRAAYLLLERLGQPVPLDQVQAASPVAPDGPMSLADLQRLFEKLGFAAEGFRMPLERVDRPVIAYLPHPDGKVGHFVVVDPVGDQSAEARDQRSEIRSQTSVGAEFLLIDPLGQPVKLPAAQLSQAWDGRVLVVYPERESAKTVGGATLGIKPGSILLWTMMAGACLVVLMAVFRLRAGRAELEASMSLKNVPRWRVGLVWAAWAKSSRLRVLAACAAGFAVIAYGANRGSLLRRNAGRVGEHPATVRIAVPAWGTALILEQGTEFDFGQVKSGERLSHTFIVKNVGRAPVPLSELRMNCACNAQVEYVALGPSPPAPLPRAGEGSGPSLPARRDSESQPSAPGGEERNPSPRPSPPRGEGVCGPGESCGIRLSMKAAGFGPQSKTIPFTIAGDGLSETLFKLKLSYRVGWVQQAQFVPERLDVGQLPCTAREATRELQLVLVGPPDEPEPEVMAITSDSPAVRFTVSRREVPEVNARSATMIPAQRVIYWLQARINPGELALGQFHTHVTARTSIGEAKLHLRGEICRPVLAAPASLLVERSRSAPVVYPIRVRHVADEAIRILAAESAARGVSCEIDSEQHEVRVQIEPDAELDAAAVEIQVQAGDAVETLRVQLVLL